MKLSKIKLAGFKSFVDPTTLILPSNLVGVVGPNGCGKSNIVDAIMWVMGEGSAKQLRGHSLKDVIFSGSTARTQVGQASVELLFDNTDGKAGGQYASYSEISIKRQAGRDAISTYYLNGSCCRKRDIQELFLGTGLGPRNYAIIEQNTISRLIDARPEELRAFIDEAAGISKYKGRRRETENRIGHTQENLNRLADLRHELATQLEHLQHQAKAATKYQQLKTEERQLNAELLAINWQAVKIHRQTDQEAIVTQENLVEAELATVRKVEKDIETSREQLLVANDALNNAQQVFYDTSSAISRFEHKIQYVNQLVLSIQQDMQRTDQQQSDIKEHLQQDKAALKVIVLDASQLEPKVEESKENSDQAYVDLNKAEQSMQEWQMQWDQCNETFADHLRQQQMAEANLQHLQQHLEECRQKIDTLQVDLESVDLAIMQKEVDEQHLYIQATKEKKCFIINELNIKDEKLSSLRARLDDLNQQRNEHSSERQKLDGRLASLDALQQSAFNTDHEGVKNWLESVDLADKPRLAQRLIVESDWLPIVEFILANCLQDIIVDVDESYIKQLSAFDKGNLGLISIVNDDVALQRSGRFPELERLSEKINIALPFLEHIYIVEDIAVAINIRSQLNAHESVITHDGMWLGRQWCRVCRELDEQKRTLSREREINQIREQCVAIGQQLEKWNDRIEDNKLAYEQVEQELNKLQMQARQKQDELSESQIVLAAKQAKQEQEQIRVVTLNETITSFNEQVSNDECALQTVQERLATVTAEYAVIKQQREVLVSLQEQYRAGLLRAREHWKNTNEGSHDMALKLNLVNSKRVALEQAVERNQAQLDHLQQHAQQLVQSLNQYNKELSTHENDLKLKLKEKIAKELSLAEARNAVQQHGAEFREFENLREVKNQKLNELQASLEQVRLTHEESRVRLSTAEEQIQAGGYVLPSLLDQLEKNADPQKWKKRLETISLKIEKLSPVNLAAIDEFSKLSERQVYLDEQNADITDALNTLQNAVHKIDKETKNTFKATFDQLNINLQEKFLQMFNGGHANLELVDRELLQTGVTLMAQPPGKRNTTIQLLSGGEKALTAIAFIFAIFALNPAPFCILDEVDAPLDDINSERFGKMMVSMSENVQFIFVTHNKITMEIAHQLLGITMQEDGVSRLVSVDIDEAVRMAANA